VGYEEDIQEQICELLRKSYVPSETEIFGDTRLFHDLNIWGDDAYEFLTIIQKRHVIDFDGFDFRAYFKQEGITLPGLEKDGPLGPGPRIKKPLTINHLVQVCKQQKWFDPE